jgi:hypothetical protein
VDKVEDERYALLECLVFDLERDKRRRRLVEYGMAFSVDDEEELFKLCLDPSGRTQVIFYTAVFVRDILKTVRKWYITS